MPGRRVAALALALLVQFSCQPTFAGNATRDAVDAIESGNVKQLERYLVSGDPNARGDNGVPLLMLAAFTGSVAMTRVLLARGADATAQSKSGQTALHAAAIGGKSAVASLLLDHGAEVNARDNNGRTALHFVVLTSVANGVQAFPFPTQWMAKRTFTATPAERAGMAKVLLDRGASVETTRKDVSLVYLAATSGDAPLLTLLIDHGAEINDGHTGETPLHSAIAERHVDIARMLVDKGANVNARNQSGRTPLHFAASLIDDPDFAELLIRHGAEVNARESKFNATPLAFAVQKGNARVADVLRRHGGSYR